MYNIHNLKEPPDFSLVLGGPLFQLLMRLHLTTPALDLLKKRIIFLTLFTWLPLLIFSILDGDAWGGVGLPFLSDLEVQARFLVALPLLIAAELLVHIRLRPIVGQFIERKIVSEKELPRFLGAIDSAMRLRNSVAIEVVLLLFAFVGGHYLSSTVSILETVVAGTGSWYAVTDTTGTHLTPAGYWYFFVSRPLFQFIVCRWYFRMFIWARLMWQCSRLELKLIPTHPDRAGGLGYLAMSSAAFLPLVLAHGVLLAGLIANSIFFAEGKLTDFSILIISFVLFLQLIILGPLIVFAPHIFRAKRMGIREYGTLATQYVSEFDSKWVGGKAADDEQLIGSADIQSLADLSNSYQIIRDMQPFPFGKDAVIQLMVFTLLPILPLTLTMVPLNELIQKLLQAIF